MGKDKNEAGEKEEEGEEEKEEEEDVKAFIDLLNITPEKYYRGSM